MSIEYFSSLPIEEQEELYARSIGNAMRIAYEINKFRRQNKLEGIIRYSELLDYFDIIPSEVRLKLERAKLCYMDKIAVDIVTDSQKPNANFVKDFLGKRHPDYMPKKEVKSTLKIEFNAEHIKRAAMLSGAKYEEIEPTIIEDSS